MSFIDHILAKHKFETVAVLILIAIFVVYIATRSVAQQVQAIPACFTVADQESAPPCTQGETVTNGIDSSTGEFADPIGSGDQDCYCTVATISVGDRVGLATGPNDPGVQGGGILFTTPADPSMNPNGAQLLAQDTSSTLFWDATLKYLGIGTSSPVTRLEIRQDDPSVNFDIGGIGFLNKVLTITNDIGVANTTAGIVFNDGYFSVAGIYSIFGITDGSALGFFTTDSYAGGSPPYALTDRKEQMRIDRFGNVGINDKSPNAILEVAGDTTGETRDRFMVSSDESHGGDFLIVKNDGNVGIGTTDPNSTLQVETPLNNTFKYFQIDIEEVSSPATPPSGDCTTSDHEGRMILIKDITNYPTSTVISIYVCADNGWRQLPGILY